MTQEEAEAYVEEVARIGRESKVAEMAEANVSGNGVRKADPRKVPELPLFLLITTVKLYYHILA